MHGDLDEAETSANAPRTLHFYAHASTITANTTHVRPPMTLRNRSSGASTSTPRANPNLSQSSPRADRVGSPSRATTHRHTRQARASPYPSPAESSTKLLWGQK